MKVLTTNATLGILFDRNINNLVIIDKQGNIIDKDLIMKLYIFLRNF